MRFSLEIYLNTLSVFLKETYETEFFAALTAIQTARDSNGHIFVAGNGGNSANADHFVTDITKGMYAATGKSLIATSLTSNTPRFSAIANDLPKEEAFAFQLRMLEADDKSVVILYSAGGNSGNIINAALEARNRGSISIGLIGGLKPKLMGSFDIQLWTKSDDIQLVEDVHAVFGHLIYKALIDNA